MLRSDLEAASFWDRAVCLDCEKVVEAAEADEDGKASCPACGSEEVYSAEFLLRVCNFVKEDGE